jgi:hypothetical protein
MVAVAGGSSAGAFPRSLHLRGEGHQPLNISTGVDIEQAPIV